MLYKIHVRQGTTEFIAPDKNDKKWWNETELAGAIRLASKLNENSLAHNQVLIKVLDSKQG